MIRAWARRCMDVLSDGKNICSKSSDGCGRQTYRQTFYARSLDNETLNYVEFDYQEDPVVTSGKVITR